MNLVCRILGHDWSEWLLQRYYHPDRRRSSQGEYRRCVRCYFEEWR